MPAQEHNFRVVYLEPPFQEWGFYRTVTIPLWRIVTDDCNLVLVTTGEYIKDSLVCLDRWGFGFSSITPYGSQFTVWGYKGSPPQPDRDYPPLKALTLLPGPRLLMNYSRNRTGWEKWNLTGWNRVDPYSYPLRDDYVEVNFHTLSLYTEAREALRTGNEWRFRIGDVINELVTNGCTWVEAISQIRNVTKLSIKQLEIMSILAQNVPMKDRAALSWVEYCRKFGLKVPKGGAYNGKKRQTSRLGSGSVGET